MVAKVSLFENITVVEPITRDVSWDELCLLFATHDYALKSKGDAPVFCPAEFAPGTTRAKRNVTRVHFGVIDIDKKPTDDVFALIDQMRRDRRAFLFYTTWSHPDAQERGLTCGRLLVPFDRTVEAWEWDAVWQRLHASTSMIGDESCRDASRVYYVPSSPAGSHDYAFSISEDGLPFVVGAQGKAPGIIVLKSKRIGVRDLQALVFSLKGSRTAHKLWVREKVMALIDGESLSPPGERDTVLWKIACAILDVYPDADAEALANLFAPSLQVMRLEANDCPSVANIADKVRRKQQEKAEEQVAVEAKHHDERARNIRAAFDLDDRDTPYTAEELASFAAAMSLNDAADFKSFWMIQKDSAFYVFVNGRYRGPFTYAEIEKAAQQYLAPAHSCGVDLFFMSPRAGDMLPKDSKRLMRDYGTLAHAVHIDMSAQSTYFDRARRTIVEAPCPLRVTEGEFDPQVARWLELLGGEQHPKLVDWLSVVTKLDEPCAAIYFEGAKGIGKSLFAEAVARLWTDRGTTALQDAMAAFNNTIVECPIIFADEAVPRDFRGQTRTGELRQFIQARTRTLRRKYLADAVFKGCVRLILAANNADLISSNEHLTVNDIEAIVDRVIHVDATHTNGVSHPARDYLESLGKTVIRSWVQDDVVARHAIWLRDNHKADTSHRFLVAGDRSRLHRRLTTSSGLRSSLCNWLVAYLLDPQKVDVTGALLIRIENGQLLVNVRAPSKHWELYDTNQDPPQAGVLSSALGGISTGEKVQMTDGTGARTHYWLVDRDNLIAWAEDVGYTTKDAIEAALRKDTKKRTTP